MVQTMAKLVVIIARENTPKEIYQTVSRWIERCEGMHFQEVEVYVREERISKWMTYLLYVFGVPVEFPSKLPRKENPREFNLDWISNEEAIVKIFRCSGGLPSTRVYSGEVI